MVKRRGGCLCGAIRYELAGKPRLGVSCYCRDCQYVSGGAPAHALVVARKDLVVQGTPRLYWTEAESGQRVAREFCEVCGTPLFTFTKKNPDRLALKVGSLDDPSDFKPQVAIWVSSAQPWHELDLGLPRFPRTPEPGRYALGEVLVAGLVKLARIIRPDAARDRAA
jgi:hypothetical protein